MSLGLGIFLAALVIAVVMLRDKVRWRRLVLGFVALVALVGSGFYLYDWYQSLPSYQNRYEDVAIGMHRDEVTYIKGAPTSGYYPTLEQKLIDEGKHSFEALLGSVLKTAELPEGLSTKDAAYWIYKKSDEAFTRVYFDGNDRVKRIECNVIGFAYSYACDLTSKIGIGSSEDKVKSVFGTPDSESIEHGQKRLRFEKYNVEFRLVKQQVTEIIVGKARPTDSEKK